MLCQQYLRKCNDYILPVICYQPWKPSSYKGSFSYIQSVQSVPATWSSATKSGGASYVNVSATGAAQIPSCPAPALLGQPPHQVQQWPFHKVYGKLQHIHKKLENGVWFWIQPFLLDSFHLFRQRQTYINKYTSDGFFRNLTFGEQLITLLPHS